MKLALKISRVIFSAVLCFASLSSHANVITNTYDPEPDRLITTYNSPFKYTHDLRPDGIPGLRIDAVDIAIYLYDISDLLHPFPEKVSFRFDGVDTRTVTNVSLYGQDYEFSLATDLLSDGLLTVSLSAGCSAKVLGICVGPQDFVFARSVLTAEVSAPAGDVPEPATLANFAIGLIISGYLHRSRNRKRQS